MASKNVILTDKAGNQLAPATTAEQVRYDGSSNVKQAIGRASGHATTANTAADMTDTTRIYVYTGSESGYTAGNWYYYDGSAWISGGQYTDGVQFETDTTLSVSGKAADAKKVGDELSDIEERVGALEQGGSGLTSEAKAALLACFRGVAWRNDVDSAALYSALDTALNPPANLSSITAVYTQSGAVDIYDSLESLRSDLVVTAHYTDNTSAVVTSYTLSGTLTIGTSTITVSYGGKTTTFNVTVTSEWDYIWDLTKSLTDTVGGVTAVASAGTGVDAPAITSAGLVFNAATQRLSLGDINLTGKTIEIDVESLDFKGNDDYHMRFLLNGSNSGPLLYKSSNGGWQGYGLTAGSTSNTTGWKSFTWIGTSQRQNRSLINGVTVKLVNETDNTITLYIDGTAVATMTTLRYGDGTQDLAIGGAIGYSQSAGDQCYDMIISGVRIKTNPVTTGGEE